MERTEQSQGDGTNTRSAESTSEEALKISARLPKLEVMRRRVAVGLALAVAGVCLGVAGLVLEAVALSVLAGLSAIAGCFVIGVVTIAPLLQHSTSSDNDLSRRIDAVTAPRMDIGAPVALDGPGGDASVIDPVTELPDGRFFEVAVDGRVAAARRHLWPVSIVLLRLGFDGDSDTPEIRNASLQSFAGLMRETLREADIACRLSEDTFGLILEDTSEEGGVWTAERLQIALSHDVTSIRRLVAGVAAYPTHGLFAKDVLLRSRAALHRASSTPAGHGFGQVEVAHVDLS